MVQMVDLHRMVLLGQLGLGRMVPNLLEVLILLEVLVVLSLLVGLVDLMVQKMAMKMD